MSTSLWIDVGDMYAIVADAPGQRNALFFDYASPELGPGLYIKWRANRILDGESMSDPALYTYDQREIRAKAEAHGVSLRYDRIIAQLLHKRRANGSLDSEDQLRLQTLIALNEEFSPFHPPRGNLHDAAHDI